MDVGLNIKISADVLGAASGLQNMEDHATNLNSALSQSQKELAQLSVAIDHAIDSGKDFSKLEDAYQKVSDRVKELRGQIGKPIIIPTEQVTQSLNSIVPAASGARGALTSLGLNAQQTRVAFLDSARAISGQGFTIRSLGSQLALLGPAGTIAFAALYGLYEVLNKTTDAQERAKEAAKKLHEELVNLKTGEQVTDEATGSEAGNIARVRDLAAAILDTNRSYKERQNALIQLRETNKAYFGDLTLEAASLKTLSDRVNEYSNALIAEAVVKGQTEAIAKLTSSLLDQVRAEEKLKTARDQANTVAAQGTGESSADADIGAGDAAGQARLNDAANKATKAFEAQRDAVFKIREQIAIYKGDLQNAVDLQLKFKPLKDPVEKKTKDDLKDIISILRETKNIYDELSKPNKEPLFKQLTDSFHKGDSSGSTDDSPIIKLIQAQIDEAKKKLAAAANDPSLANAYKGLITALSKKLNAVENPNAISFIQGIVTVKPEDADIAETKIEKAFGKKGLDIKIPLHIQQAIDNTGAFDTQDIEKIKKGFETDPSLAKMFVVAVPEVQIAIGKALIREQDLKKLKQVIEEVGKSVVVGGFADIGKALGDALSGSKNPLQAAIASFTQVLGDGLIKIGEAMIEASTVVVAIQAALKGLFGDAIGGVVAGVAAVAAGELIKNVGAHAFAEGGIVTGPTLGLVGEAGPEAIFPLSKLNSFIKNTKGASDQHVSGEFTIRGNDLKLVLARANKNQSLV